MLPQRPGAPHGLTVYARETARDVEFTVETPPDASMLIQVDRNQNGKVDGSVDVIYSRGDGGKPCYVYLLGTGKHAITPCGRFRSTAKFVPHKDKKNNGYVLTVPKKELSLAGNSVRMTFWVMVRDGKSFRSLFPPSEFFEKPVEFKFEQK